MKAWRIILAVAGIALVSFGVFRLATEVSPRSLVFLGLWLAAALIIHDGIVAPAVVGGGWVLRRFVPDRGRRYLQAALIASAMVTVIALPLIYFRGSQPPVKALLLRDYGANLAGILSGIALLTLASYLVRVVRDRSSASTRSQPTPGPGSERRYRAPPSGGGASRGVVSSASDDDVGGVERDARGAR